MRQNRVKYTFLLPAYKVTFLEEALISIRNQSLKDFNCLVSDDCSPENIKGVFDKTVGDDPRFVYRCNEENMGGKSLVSHWNLLVGLCGTDYLIMASDDDIYGIDFLKQIDVLIEKYPKLDIFRAKARRSGDGITILTDGNMPELLAQSEFQEYFGRKTMVHCLANYVFKTSALQAMGSFPDFPKAAKSDSATAICLSKNGIAVTKDVLFTFRMSHENLSSVNGYEKNLIDTANANLMFADWYKKKFGIAYPYKSFVEDVVFYLSARMHLVSCFRYYFAFRRRGYFCGIKPLFTICKNWMKIHYEN
jgi:glycosyltransferase involved in cell wall biosynthesis